jgi:AcrR family transcriptional regulator
MGTQGGSAVVAAGARAARSTATRELILTAAERLFAEHGVVAVSNRQVGEAAGQGNTAAVGYHFGTKADLVRAIVRRRTGQIERIRAEMLAVLTGDDPAGDAVDDTALGLRDWIACLVRPNVEHLAELGTPTWSARFSAQVMTDPALRVIIIEESLGSPALRRIREGMGRLLSGLPPEVHEERGEMSRLLMLHVLAERERALADGLPTPRASWADAGTGLIDAIVGVWSAPITAAG